MLTTPVPDRVGHPQPELGRKLGYYLLRHTTAIELLLEKPALVTTVKRFPGHVSLRTTRRYTDFLKLRQLKAIVNGAE